jgi:hypothetical protein
MVMDLTIVLAETVASTVRNACKRNDNRTLAIVGLRFAIASPSSCPFAEFDKRGSEVS